MVEVKRKLKVPIYGGLIVIVISDEDSVYDSALRNFKTDSYNLKFCDAVVLGKESGSERIYPVLFSKYITPGMIAHEAKHVINKMFIDIGIHLDPDNDEPEAYLLMWLVNRIWEVKTQYEKKIENEKPS